MPVGYKCVGVGVVGNDVGVVGNNVGVIKDPNGDVVKRCNQ